MHRYNLSFFLLALILITGCIPYTKQNSKKVFRDGVNMLYGEITPEDLFSEYPTWRDDYMRYEPDSTIISELSSAHPDLKIEVFMGTWCSDSRREIPRFFKTIDLSKCVQKDQIKMWAVDRDKSLESGLTDEREIVSVSTFIFYRNDNEIGRIIEQPDHENLETDILSIVKGY